MNYDVYIFKLKILLHTILDLFIVYENIHFEYDGRLIRVANILRRSRTSLVRAEVLR